MPQAQAAQDCRLIKADVVALEQAYVLNRFGAFVPAGMLFALKGDVVALDDSKSIGPGNARLRLGKRPRPLVLRANEGDCLQVSFTNWLSPTAEAEGGIPLENGGQIRGEDGVLRRPQKVSLDAPRTRAASFHITGLEPARIADEDCPRDVACNGNGTNVGLPAQSGVTFHPETDAATRGRFETGSLAAPGQTVVTRWRARREGAYFAYSAAAPVGGEGDGGQIGLGLFAAVNVEPAGSRWYRSQVTQAELAAERTEATHPFSAIDYEKFALLDGDVLRHGDLNAIVVQDEHHVARRPDCQAFGTVCQRAFREFTVIFHDEVHAEQAFAALDDENDPLHFIKDGMGINYGVSSMGSLMMGTPQFGKPSGPAKDCPECRAEEFFLSSWANGDPALILHYGPDGKPNGAQYPDDPSNVHHSYLGDPVRFRNIHAGPKETHVFHLHAHQWVFDATDPNPAYLDSQTISPGASFSYDIEFGGSGNRNLTPGDSIFHCHLYPHFAQGMWELWRSHDAFEDGTRTLPDYEVAGGTQTPAIVPIPGNALAPMPTAEFPGYPHYMPGKPGHRPPQPVLDMDVAGDPNDPAADIANGGLPRHVVRSGTLLPAKSAEAVALSAGGEAAQMIALRVAKQSPASLTRLYKEWGTLEIERVPHGGTPAERNAMAFHAGTLSAPGLQPVDMTAAMQPNPETWWSAHGYATAFAATTPLQTPRSEPAVFAVNARPPQPGAPYADPCPDGVPLRRYRTAFIQTELTVNKHGWFDPQGRMVVLENDIKDTIDANIRTRPPEPLFFRANSGECIEFKSSNFVPKALNADDFQIYMPTDTIGQHIHLVKFDVTSSDGSGNGFNYEDATFSPEEVRERIFAVNRALPPGSPDRLTPKAHPLFLPGGDIHKAAQNDGSFAALLARGTCPAQAPGQGDDDYERDLRKNHDLCGAQRTTQRWWADPILNRTTKQDGTLRTVFTHDHMGPSSHQQHGLYAGLVIEPANSVWAHVGATFKPEDWTGTTCANPGHAAPACDRLIGGSDLREAPLAADAVPILGGVRPRPPLVVREDGGPTATRANVLAPACIGDPFSSPAQPTGQTSCTPERQSNDTRREFALAIADFGVTYNTALEPINPEPINGEAIQRDNSNIRFGRRHVATALARPLAISSEDPGSQFINYRHEPAPLRLATATPDPVMGGFDYRQIPCAAGDQACAGDPANLFSTAVHAKRDREIALERRDLAGLKANVTSANRDLFNGTPYETKLDNVLQSVERWRQDFNCMLYPTSLMAESGGGAPCRAGLRRDEVWRTFGDPATPILPAYDGDRVQIRLVQGAQEAQHIFTMNGVKWHRHAGSNGASSANRSGFTNAQPIGISEHFEFDLLLDPTGASSIDRLYFGSSIDQLWDGLWGVMRSYGPGATPHPVKTSAVPDVWPLTLGARAFLAPLHPDQAPPEPPNGDRANLCADSALPDPTVQHILFEVSALRACDLFGNCGSPNQTGILYNERLGLEDRKALVYVLERPETTCATSDCRAEREEAFGRLNRDVRAELQWQFGHGRRLEPMVLRAAAGQCLHVQLRNQVPAALEDGPAPGREVEERFASHNHLPMIADGFNMNQFRMSSSVGLSAPRVAQHPLHDDGSNVGLNDAVLRSYPGADQVPQRQGSLVPPCPGRDAADPRDEDGCKRVYTWSATDFSADPAAMGQPLEFGALPLRSLADPFKHPAHGLIGALVIGPQGSHACPNDRFAPAPLQKIGKDGKTTLVPLPRGISAEICGGAIAGRYADHVLVLQDAVNATRGGMPVPNLAGAEEPDDYGVKAINYSTDPLWGRAGNDPSVNFSERAENDYAHVLSSAVLSSAAFRPGSATPGCKAGIVPLPRLTHPCDPLVPILEARAGERMRLNIVHPGGHTRQQGVAVTGHAWNPYPWSDDSRTIDPTRGSSIRQGVFNGFGPMMGVTLPMSAGGEDGLPMDYLVRSQASFLFDGGIWAILRVRP